MACVTTSFFFIGLIILHCMDTTHFDYPLISWWTFWFVSTFCLLWILLLWTFVYRYLFEYLFSLEYIPGSGITGSYGNCMFSFLRNHQTDFHSGCTILNFHQQYTRVAISLDHCQHLFPFFKNYSHPNGCEVISFLLASP